ncbi:MAG: hypothetical protein U1F59_00530 [Candidatus Competibacteraceae bacterium]
MNPSRRKPILAALLVAAWALTVAVPARSADGDAPSTTPASPQAPPAARSGPPDPPVVERLRASGLDMQPGGIIGRDFRFWLIAAKDGRRAFAATTSEGYLVLGKIYSPDGSLNLDTEGQTPLFLDAEDRRAHGLARLTGATPTPATDFAWRTPGRRAAAGPPGTVWDLLGHATAIEEGRVGAPLVYIFVDPYCSYCHRQWEVLRKKVQAGSLRVRWALVAALDRSQADLGVVGGLLADPRPETLAVWMREQRVRRSESEAAKKALGANMALFQALKAPSVPAILYKDKTGKLVTRVGVTDL